MTPTDRARAAYRKEIARLNRATDTEIDWSMAEREAAFLAAEARGAAAMRERAVTFLRVGNWDKPDYASNFAYMIEALPTPSPIRTAEAERAAIVKWGRDLVANNDADDRFGPPILIDNDTVLKIMDAIERGDHLPKPKEQADG